MSTKKVHLTKVIEILGSLAANIIFLPGVPYRANSFRFF